MNKTAFCGVVACVAWRFWLGALSNKGGRGQRNREEIGRPARQNRHATQVSGVEFKYAWHLRPVQLHPAALTDTRKAVTQLQRPLRGQKKSVAVLRCNAFTSGTFLWHRSERFI